LSGIKIRRRGVTRRFAKRSGQGITEMFFALPIVIVATMYIVQMGLIMNAYASLKEVARESARFAAMNALAQNDAIITSQIAVYCNGTGVEYSDITPSISPVANDASRKSGNPIAVTLSYNMTRKFFLPYGSSGAKPFPGMNVISHTYNVTATSTIE